MLKHYELLHNNLLHSLALAFIFDHRVIELVIHQIPFAMAGSIFEFSLDMNVYF